MSRAASVEALQRRVEIIEASGYKIHGWNDGDIRHRRAFRFEDPFGYVLELDNGRRGECRFTVNNKTYTLACNEDHGGGTGRLSTTHRVRRA